MVYKVIITKESKSDVAEIVTWYSEISEQLANKFLFELDDELRKIAEYPLLFSTVTKSIYRGRLRAFPYNIFFKILSDTILIGGIIHQKRNPRIWEKRLK